MPSKRLLVLVSAVIVASMVYWSNMGAQNPGPRRPVPTYLGEICLQWEITEDENGPVSPPVTYTTKAGLLRVGQDAGAQRYQIQGLTTFPVPDEVPTAGGGFIEITETEAIGTLMGARDELPANPWRSVVIQQIRMDPALSSGTFWTIGNSYNTEDAMFDTFYFSGNMSRVACP